MKHWKLLKVGRANLFSCGISVLGAIAAFLYVFPVNAAPNSDHSKAGGTDSYLNSLQIVADDFHPKVVDPKTGQLMWTAVCTVAHTLPAGSYNVEMDHVKGTLYEKGRPANDFAAKKLIYNYQAKIVKGFGGVKLVSLTEQSTTMTCDNFIWYTTENKIIGSGHVVVYSKGTSQHVSSFQANTKLQDVVIPAPGDTTNQPNYVTIEP